jgi:hypothetical protein
VHDVAAGADRDQLPHRVASLLERHDHTLARRRAEHRKWVDANQTRDDGLTTEQHQWLRQQVDRQRERQARDRQPGRGHGQGQGQGLSL